jgi:hypothetical protein
LKRLQSSEPLLAKINLTSCFFGSRFVYNPFFLLAGALLFDEKICQSVALFWFGLRDVRFSSNILLTSRNPKNCGLSRSFGDRFGGKEFGLCTYRVPNKKEE